MIQIAVIEPFGYHGVVDTETDLATFQKLVGGYIEFIHGPGWTAMFNEEGRIRGLPVNMTATVMAYALGWPGTSDLRGTVVFMGPPVNDEPSSIPAPLAALVRNLV